MKILVLSHLYPSIFNEMFGIFVHQQVKALRRCGVELKVVAPVPWAPFPIKNLSKKWLHYSQIPKYENRENIEVLHPPYPTFPKSLFFSLTGKTMFYWIRRRIEKIRKTFAFDLIHAHTVLPSGYAAMRLSLNVGVPFVLTVHGLDFNETYFRGTNYQEYIGEVVKNASYIMVVSNKLKRLSLNLLPLISEKVKVVHNGFEVRDIYQERHGKSPWPGQTVILSVSNLIPEKGIEYNLKAIARLRESHKDIFYVIVGDGPERERLRQLSKDLGIEQHVEFRGQVTHKKVMELMSYCDIFSLPSYKEGFGIVYLEAMAQGKPVIGCKGEGGEDIIVDRKTGMLVKPRDLQDLVQAIEFLIKRPKAAKEMGTRSRRMVLSRYTWERNAKETMEIYQKALHAKR